MRFLAQFFSTLALVGGIVFAALAIITPGGYSLRGASAIQITQVYSEATYYGIVAIALFAFALVLQVASNAAQSDRSREQIGTSTHYINAELLQVKAELNELHTTTQAIVRMLRERFSQPR